MTQAYRPLNHDIITCVCAFVTQFDDKQDVQFSAVPFLLDSHEGIGYLLMVASVNQRAPAEGIRDLMRKVYDQMLTSGIDIFTYHTVNRDRRADFLNRLRNGNLVRKHHMQHWSLWESVLGTDQMKVDRILERASKFIADQAAQPDGLVTFGMRSGTAQAAINTIATKIYYMGCDATGARKKVWMFMRWMVRPHPDIGIWSPPLHPRDLRVPLDTNTCKAFHTLASVPAIKAHMTDVDIHLTRATTATNVEAVTAMARWFFPDDPAKVDYAFFCFGRRFESGEDADRCWAIVDCAQCTLRTLVNCVGKY